ISYRQITRLQLRNSLRDRLVSPRFHSDSELNSHLNSAIRLFQLATATWRSRFQFFTVANRVFYDLSSAPAPLGPNGEPLILMPLRVSLNSQILDFCDSLSLDSLVPSWQTDSSSPASGDGPKWWGTMGCSWLYVSPADPDGSNSLVIDAAIRAPTLSSDASFLNLDASLVPTLLNYAEVLSSFK